MVKPKKDLYRRLRKSGVRKRIARDVSELANTGAPAPRARRETVERLTAAVEELQELIRRAERGDDVPAEHRSVDDGHAIEIAEPASLRVGD